MNTLPPPRPPAPPPKAAGQSLALARPRRLLRRGRAALLWFVGFYALGQLAFDLVLYRWHPTLQDNCQAHKLRQLRELAAREPDRPLLVMLGSSRAQCAFQASRLNGLPGPGGKPLLAYNLGVPMAGHIHSRLHLREMLDAGIRPRVLLVEYVTPLLNEPQPDRVSEENWTLGPWLSLPHLASSWPYFAHPGEKAGEWLEARTSPWYVFRSHLWDWWLESHSRKAIAHAERDHDPWGLRFAEPRISREERDLRLVIAHHLIGPTLRDFQVGTGPRRAMRDLLETARRERIPVVLVLMPESTAFRSWYRPEGLADALREFAELRDAFGVDAIDASRWVADDDFRDGHHVEESGARAFTTRLIEELRPILARIWEATPRTNDPGVIAAAGPP
jgi:hypothetical protein